MCKCCWHTLYRVTYACTPPSLIALFAATVARPAVAVDVEGAHSACPRRGLSASAADLLRRYARGNRGRGEFMKRPFARRKQIIVNKSCEKIAPVSDAVISIYNAFKKSFFFLELWLINSNRLNENLVYRFYSIF